MGMTMTKAAQEARRSYQREYRHRNKERINEQRKEWRRRNPDKTKEYQAKYWESKAGKQSIRAPWSVYNIDKKRLEELTEIVKSGKYDTLVLSSAIKADQMCAGYIILSGSKSLSYEHIEFDDRLGRCSLGRTDFYGARRLFFHYLDVALKENQIEIEKG